MNVATRHDAEETKRLIRNRLSGDDDAIQMETLRISLLCPVSVSVFFSTTDCQNYTSNLYIYISASYHTSIYILILLFFFSTVSTE